MVIFFPWLPRYVWQQGAMRYTTVRARGRVCAVRLCVCLCLGVHICVCTQAHLIRLVCVRECVRPGARVCLPCSKVSHLSGR